MDFDAFQAAMDAETSDAVKLWMNWMTGIFLACLLFVWKFKAARAALLAFILTAIGAIIVWMATQNVHLLGIVHLVVWIPLALYVWKTTFAPSAPSPEGAYARAHLVWAALLLVTILVSLVFDVRDIFLVATGAK